MKTLSVTFLFICMAAIACCELQGGERALLADDHHRSSYHHANYFHDEDEHDHRHGPSGWDRSRIDHQHNDWDSHHDHDSNHHDGHADAHRGEQQQGPHGDQHSHAPMDQPDHAAGQSQQPSNQFRAPAPPPSGTGTAHTGQSHDSNPQQHQPTSSQPQPPANPTTPSGQQGSRQPGGPSSAPGSWQQPSAPGSPSGGRSGRALRQDYDASGMDSWVLEAEATPDLENSSDDAWTGYAEASAVPEETMLEPEGHSDGFWAADEPEGQSEQATIAGNEAGVAQYGAEATPRLQVTPEGVLLTYDDAVPLLVTEPVAQPEASLAADAAAATAVPAAPVAQDSQETAVLNYGEAIADPVIHPQAISAASDAAVTATPTESQDTPQGVSLSYDSAVGQTEAILVATAPVVQSEQVASATDAAAVPAADTAASTISEVQVNPATSAAAPATSEWQDTLQSESLSYEDTVSEPNGQSEVNWAASAPSADEALDSQAAASGDNSTGDLLSGDASTAERKLLKADNGFYPWVTGRNTNRYRGGFYQYDPHYYSGLAHASAPQAARAPRKLLG